MLPVKKYIQAEIKEWKMIFHANEEQKGAGVVTLISVYFIDSEWMKKEKPDKYTCR